MMKTSAIRLPRAATATVVAASLALLAGTALLWAAYGERVYFDAIMTGLASCFSY